MSKLSDFLVESIVGKPIITFGGGFKPPTYGHLSVVKKAIKKYPTREKFIIFVGSGERDGITQEESYKIWNIYKKYLPEDVEIIKSTSPIKSILNYSKKNPDKEVICIIGGREENEQDVKDFGGKTKSFTKYPNLTPVNIMTTGGVSGTLARQALNKSKEEFFKYLPPELTDEDKEEIYSILKPQELTEMKDKIPGGLAKGKSLKDLAEKHKTSVDNIKHQLKKGLKVEMEHTTDKRIALEIAMDHVWESANYYDKLGIIEESEDDIISMANDVISYIKESWENYQHLIKAIDALEDRYNIPVQQTAEKSVRLFANQIGAPAIEPLYRLTKQAGLLKENQINGREINYNSIVNELNSYAQKKGWKVEPLPELKLIEGDVNNSKDFFGKTAYYEPSTKVIALYTEGRHAKDIMRSYCHELRHHHQNLEGRLQNINTENVNEDDYLKEIEKDAYLEGNLLFREWENSRKSLNEEVKIEKTEDYIEVDIIEDDKIIGNITLESYDGKNYTIIDANVEEAYRGKGLYKKAIIDTLNENPHIKITSAFRSKDAEFAWNSLLKNLPPNIKKNIINRRAERTKEITLSLNEYVNNAKQVLYCDLDGVLGDFDARFQYFAKMKPQDYEKKYGKEAFWDLIDNQVGEIFWTGIEWMPEGEKLWNYIKKYNPIILSAPSRNPVSRMGKKIWVEEKMPGTRLILASRENKMEYSGENKILIDDRADTISEWIAKGGIGILFTSTSQTIAELEKLNLKVPIDENEKLPNNLKVSGYLDLRSTEIEELPDNLEVGTVIVVTDGKEQYFMDNFPKFRNKIK